MANNIIKGRKGGSSSQRTPTEQPDDLQSVAKAKILIALGEGEFAGGLTGKDIYLDGTPLENADGSQNFSGVAWEFRPGTQAQSYIQGIPGTENEISVGTEVSSQTAWTHTFTNTQLSAVRVRLKWPSLMKQEDDGDVVGNTVKYAIDLQTDGGAWQTVLETAVSGKTTSGYERSHRIDLPQAGSTWTLRLRKVSPDANSVKIGDVMTLQSYTEVIDAKLRYPHTALLYIEFDSSQFNGSIPQISCEPRGRVIRVPDNYNPETREYTGTWTGGFKWAWTDNPAWIYYDIVVSDRFGLGDRLTSANISKWALYPIAQYCDQLVPDGRGGDGMEPRYICNVYVQERNDAYTVLRDFAAIFRGMTCWSGEQIIVQADMPRDVDFNYTRANILGSPRYSSSTSKARYTNALVSWSDPDNAYADAMEPAFIPELVSRYSFNQLEVTAIGCTRQSEAHRKGLWGILTNNKDRMVEIDVGLDGRIPQPGYIIGLGDERLAGRVNGGRISAVNGRVITLDRDIDAKEGDRLHLNLPSGISQARTIQSVNGRRQVTVTTAYSETPEAECVWIVEYTDLVPQQYRVIGVKDNNNGTLTITGVAHDPDKFPRIDIGAIIDQRPVSVLPAGNQSPPDDIVITSRSVVNQGISVETMQVNWSAVSGAISYEAQWRRNEGNWISVPRNSTTSFEVSGIYAGRYLVRVRAINAAEISSGWAYSEEKTLTGKVGEPLPPLALTTASLTAGIEIRWEFPEGAEDTQRTELQYSPDQDGKGALPLTDLAYPGKKYQQMGLKIATQFWYRARLIDRLGNASPWTGWVKGMSSENVDDYYQQLDDAIKDTDTYEELTGGIKEVSDSAQAAKDAAQAAQVTADGAVATNKQQQQQLNDQLADIQQNAKDITDAANAGAANAGAIAQEILDRQAGDLATANKAASDVADAIAKAETDDAEVAAQAAANLLATKNEVEAQISTTNTTMQDGFDSLAQQMASIAAGTGEQFDSLKIWYFEKDAEGWASDDSNINILPVDSDGWIYPAGASSTMRSPNPLAIDGQSYKYIRLRMKRVGNPAWAGRLYWIGVNEQGWSADRSVSIPAPDFDPATGISVISIPDLLWANSGTIRRLRLDFSNNQSADNYFAVDWLAVGRPTPGASQAQIQDLKTAMTAADSAEAAARNTLAVQLRGNYEGTDPAKLVTGIIYNERQTRVTAEQAISSDVNTLRTDYNANKAAVTQRLDTLTSENQSQAQALTQLQSGLTDANGKIGANTTAINQLKTDVSDIDGRVTANSSLITGLESTINNDAIALAANPNNLLTNTGFERDKAAWTGFNAYADIYAAQVPHSGSKILRGKAGGIAGITQLVANVKKGRTYRFGGYVKRSSDMTAGAVGNNKFRLGNADTGAGPLSELNYTQSNVGTNWTLLTKDYVPFSDMTMAFSINWILNSGEIYFDDVFFIDVTDEINNAANASAISGLTTRVTAAEGKISTNSQSITQLKGDVSILQGQIANKADASALQQLQTTVSQQGDKLASQGSAITELQNTAQNGKAKYWLTKIFDIKVSGSGYIPKLSDLSGVPPLAVSEMADAAKLDFLTYGDYKIAYAKSLVYLNADKTIEIAPGSRIVDDTGRLYVNGVETASFSASATKYSFALKKGWSTIEFVVANITGQFFINLGLKLSDNVDQLFSGAGQMAAASAAQVISSQVEQTAGKVDANSSAILTLNNSVKDINTALNNKADASALQSLTTRVSNAEGKITSQGNAITQLTNDLSTANGKITANTGAISSLTSRVTAAEGKIDSQAESITSINSSIKGILTQAANLIPNPTVDPAYPQMGMTVVSTTSEGVPAGCPYAWAIKCQYRDHVPVMNNIPCHEGQVFEISVLAACGTGTAPFQHYIGTSTQAAGSIGSPQANGGQISAATGAQWTRTTWRFKPNTTHAAKGYFRPFLQINQSGPDFGTVWYATDWQVRDVTAAANAEGKADANATAISQLTTRVTNAEGKITSQGQAITKLTSDLSTLTGVVNSKADASALNALTTRVSSAEGKIASQGQSITQLTNSISNTESAMDAQGKIPGNLLANASFERGQVAFDGWSDLTDVIDATNPHSGGKILRMNAGASVKIGQSIEVTQGRRYRFGVFARQNAGTEIQDPANTKFRIADGSDNLLAAVNYGPFTTTWQHVSMDWTASKNTVAKFQLTAFLKSGSMYFDDVYVVDITNETNIKGNADAITSLNTKVTQQGNDITSQSNAITNLSNSLKTQQYANSNPWIDGSFESYSDGQALSGANAVVTTEYAFSGSKSLKCRRADGETGNSDKMFGYETSIREEAVYRYECWAMMPEGETPPNGWGCNVGMIVRTAAGTAAWPTAFAINEAALTAGGGRGKWVKFSGKLAIDGKQKTRGRLWISTRGTAGGPGYRLYIDDLVITDVTDAHAAQTTADANSSAISGLTSRVSTAEGKITAQADSITKLTGEINTINGTLNQKADASAVNALQSRVTTAEGKIDSQGTAITQLTNGLEAYRRTGENLVQNFDFLQGNTAYNVQNASKVTFGDYGDGKVGVRMVRTDGNSPGIFANNKKPIPQNGQRRYRYVVRAKGVSGAMNLLMRRWNYNGTVEGPGVDKNFTLTTSWQTLTWETDLTPATGVDGSAFGLYCHPSNAEIWIDSFKVYDITEEVTIKANSDALSTLTSTVTQNGKDIAAQANALTQLKSSLTNDAVALATNPNNMVANSGFERGTDNWSGFNAYADIYAAQSPRTGAYIMRGLPGGNVAVSQVILGIKKGRTYRYGGYMRRDSNTTIGNQGNNKFRIGNADTGAGPIHQVEYSQSNVGTSWTLITGDWVPASDQNIAFSINVLLTAGNFYFDDIFFVDVTDEINNAANATAITNLTTRVTSAEGKITSQGTAITQLTSDLSTANGKITANANAITSLKSTVTQQGNTLTTQGQAITKLNSDLSDLSGVVDTKASASAVSQLTTRVTNAEGKITANSTALNSITSRVDDAESAIDGLNETTAANGLAMANGFQQLRAQIGDNQAAITQTNKAVVDLESATAQQIDTINASMDGMSATVQQTSTAVADINGKLSAQWGVKVQTDTGGGNPRIAGIQLGIDASGSSQFLVMADTFAVYTGGTNKTYPFVVQNGVAYMQEALIRDGSITNAKIGNEIKSNNFVDGSQGWRIGKDGSSQFNNVIVRGAVYATDGWFNGTVYANRIEGDIGSFAINIAQHRTRKVPKATWQWFELARFRRQNFDQVINIRGGLMQSDSITIDGGAKLRAGMSYSSGSDGGLDPGFLSYAILLRGTGATSGGGSMEIGLELAYETGGADRLRTAQASMDIDSMSFVVPAGTGDAILRYGCYLDRNGQMVLTILSRFDAFSARNNNVIRGSSSP
ncbi:gp24 [Klebsiella pneumoniae]|uniref:TipJ family phage tail tip protein n=1 Tax=Klebsiella pneumoniae TaxID=573 RepID=UPI000E2BB619|nr:carbohydrate binding domain-containing protein [Klebsiella pneumoniae]MDX7152902.1 carbohydrate binding domain-containing protein [Klebsiella pneumoniae]SVL09765.1 gp24 [Klebsiella pneumoniae]SVL09924.1 gp24 [Klebsiella pneumoniae]SVS64875.1 gp24 [Klebsiella pneumoniae]VUG75331.1 gp24 [Klebsiella pneumoniae]